MKGKVFAMFFLFQNMDGEGQIFINNTISKVKGFFWSPYILSSAAECYQAPESLFNAFHLRKMTILEVK